MIKLLRPCNIENVYLRRAHLMTITPILFSVMIVALFMAKAYELIKDDIVWEIKCAYFGALDLWRKDYK